MPRFHICVLLATAAILAACQSRHAVISAGIAEHVAGPQDEPQPCNAEPVQHLLGQEANDAVVTQAVKVSGAAAYRVLAPNTPATLDLSQYRLNIITDANGLITALHCG